MQAGRFEEAVPVLRRAVASWPEDSRDIEYAYALFNLGRALRLSGDPAAAIPYLEKRLTFEDQREHGRAGAEAGAQGGRAPTSQATTAAPSASTMRGRSPKGSASSVSAPARS